MSIEFRHIAYDYGQHQALGDVNLVAPAGQITCLLGSSGCGKTTLLNLAAGLLRLQTGSIHLNGELLADGDHHPPPEKRPVGLVFQNGALFPHMTIAENIRFGLPNGADAQDAADNWLRQIGLDGLGGRYPDSLSGGQQQRVALARAMAPEPKVLLLDEPFASVDIVLRRSLRRECRRLLKSRGATAILVTHDPEEARDIGDTIAVMDKGEIVQMGSAGELYDAPASAMVGKLFADAQIVPATHEKGALQTGFGRWPMSCLSQSSGTLEEGIELDLLVRQDALRVSPITNGAAAGATLIDLRRVGAGYLMELENEAGDRLSLRSENPQDHEPGRRWSAAPLEGSVIAFPRGS